MQAQLNRGMKIKTFLEHHHHEFLNLLGTGSHENILNVLDFVQYMYTVHFKLCVVWCMVCWLQCSVLCALGTCMVSAFVQRERLCSVEND